MGSFGWGSNSSSNFSQQDPRLKPPSPPPFLRLCGREPQKTQSLCFPKPRFSKIDDKDGNEEDGDMEELDEELNEVGGSWPNWAETDQTYRIFPPRDAANHLNILIYPY